MKQWYYYHYHADDAFPATARLEVVHLAYTTAICQQFNKLTKYSRSDEMPYFLSV